MKQVKPMINQKAMSQRQHRVSALIREVIAESLARGCGVSPAVSGALITVSDVWVSPDLRNARVYFTTAAKNVDIHDVEAELNMAGSVFGHELGRKLRIKYIPRLVFTYDDSFDHAERMDELFKKINKHTSAA